MDYLRDHLVVDEINKLKASKIDSLNNLLNECSCKLLNDNCNGCHDMIFNFDDTLETTLTTVDPHKVEMLLNKIVLRERCSESLTAINLLNEECLQLEDLLKRKTIIEQQLIKLNSSL